MATKKKPRYHLEWQHLESGRWWTFSFKTFRSKKAANVDLAKLVLGGYPCPMRVVRRFRET
jgi:hypothetical protein